jgi:ATP-binding cassette, subfamily G (WHITE), eye pigment precursor transporter
MVGLNESAGRFFLFMLVIVLTSNCAFSLGYVISTATPTVQVALAIGPVVLLPFMIFGGFLINVNDIPKYFYWLSYISFFKYGFEALATAHFEGLPMSCSDAIGPICKYPTGQAVLDQYSLDADAVWQNVGILFALLVGFRVIAFLALYRRAKSKETAAGP